MHHEILWQALFLETGQLMGDSSRALLEAFYRDCRLRNLADKTLDGYAERLAFLVDKFQGREIADISGNDIRDYVASIVGKVSPATVNGRIRVFRLFFRWLADNGVIQEEPTKKIRLLKEDVGLKKTLTISEVDALLSVFDKKTFEGNRNTTMFMTMFDSMIRVGELVRLAMDDLHLEDRHIVVQKSKSRRFRAVPIGLETARTINIYLLRWRRGIAGDLVFPNADGGKLREDSTYHIIQRAGRKIGIHVYPHMIRRTAATEYVANGGPMSTVQGILGHADPRTTMAYVQYQSGPAGALHQQYSPANRLKKIR